MSHDKKPRTETYADLEGVSRKELEKMIVKRIAMHLAIRLGLGLVLHLIGRAVIPRVAAKLDS